MKLPFFVKKENDTDMTGVDGIIERATLRESESDEPITHFENLEVEVVKENKQTEPEAKPVSGFKRNKAERRKEAYRKALEIHSTNLTGRKKPEDMFGLKTVKVLEKPVKERFDDMHKTIKDVVVGTVLSVVIYGTAGVGKTHSVKKALSEAGREEGKDWIILTSDCTPAGLYETALKFRGKDKIIVLDDIDFDTGSNGKAMWELVKAMTDTYATRTVARTNRSTGFKLVSSAAEAEEYLAKCEKEGKDPKVPSMFGFKGKLLVITNLPESFFDEAYLSRSVTVPLFLTEDEKIEHMRMVLREMNPNMDYFTKERVLNALHEQHIEDTELNKLAGTDKLNRKQFDLRTLEIALKMAESDPNWKERLHLL